MKNKEGIANLLLKGAIVGGGALLGLGLSKLFHVEAEEVGTDGEVPTETMEVPFEEVTTETTEN